MSRSVFRTLMTVVWLVAPGVAFAHPGHGGDGGHLLAGFMHPLSGIDHLLAMIAVGLFAAHLGGRALWAVPATFVAVAAFGGILGAAGVSLPLVEIAIALSVAVFGLVILTGIAPSVLSAMMLVGFFALFHGHAHGSEIPANSSWLGYGLGFLAATALLHGLGITLGLATRWFDEAPRRRAMQACGAVIGLIGTGLVLGLV